MAEEERPPLASDFHSGQEVPVSGIYFVARHVDGSKCDVGFSESRGVFRRGEVFPIHERCSKGVIWLLITYREEEE
jgi:hypothetical protein